MSTSSILNGDYDKDGTLFTRAFLHNSKVAAHKSPVNTRPSGRWTLPYTYNLIRRPPVWQGETVETLLLIFNHLAGDWSWFWGGLDWLCEPKYFEAFVVGDFGDFREVVGGTFFKGNESVYYDEGVSIFLK